MTCGVTDLPKWASQSNGHLCATTSARQTSHISLDQAVARLEIRMHKLEPGDNLLVSRACTWEQAIHCMQLCLKKLHDMESDIGARLVECMHHKAGKQPHAIPAVITECMLQCTLPGHVVGQASSDPPIVDWVAIDKHVIDLSIGMA